MATNFKLIKEAHNRDLELQQENKTILGGLNEQASTMGVTASALAESVLHVLANIAAYANDGKEIKAMSADSVAAFLAGVEVLSNQLPISQDEQKKQNTLRVLQQASIGPDGLVTTAVAPIAQLGARKADLLGKYKQMMQTYMASVHGGKPNGSELAHVAKQLQSAIDRAMRTTVQPQKVAAPSM